MMRPKGLLSSALILAVVTMAAGSDAAPKKPKKRPKPAATEAAPTGDDASSPFDKQAASSALSSIDLLKCKSTNAPRGEGHVLVKFAPAGTATEATVDKGPLVGTPVAKCIAKEFKKVKIPAFAGEVVQVGKSFRFE